jgi:hypothetical protein
LGQQRDGVDGDAACSEVLFISNFSISSPRTDRGSLSSLTYHFHMDKNSGELIEVLNAAYSIEQVSLIRYLRLWLTPDGLSPFPSLVKFAN